MSKKKELYKFFSEIQNLMKWKYSLQKSISLLENSGLKNSKKTLLAKKIKRKLEEGYDFYNALCSCGFEKEIENYKTLISSEEKDFQLQKNLEYIVETEKQNQNFQRNLLSVFVYPAFIVFCSCLLTFYLITNKEKFFAFTLLKHENYENITRGVFMAFGFLMSYCITFFLFVYNFLKTTFPKKLLFALYFLLQQNYTLRDALQILIISERKSKNLFFLGKMQNLLEEGSDFFNCLKQLKIFSKKQLNFMEKTQWIKDFREVFEEYFFIEKNVEKQRLETVQKYSEGILILGIGIYLLILIKNTFLVFLTF